MEGTLNDASSSAIEVPQSRQQRPMLEIAGLRKRFGAVEVLRDVSLAVNPGEVVVVIGPSGSGKTTLLRCINLLEEYESGTITIDGEPIGYRFDARAGRRLLMSERDVAAARARIGMVFQSYNLFPHMSVLQNIVAAPVRVRGIEHRQAEARAHELLAMGRVVGQGGRIPDPAFRRAATARGNRPCAGDGPQDHAVRRDYLGARPRARRRGLGGNAAARERRHDADRPRSGSSHPPASVRSLW